MGEHTAKTLSVIEPQDVAKVTQKDLDDYLFGTGAKLTEPQKRLFYGIALSLNLNPLKREIYAVAYGTNFNIITGYEVYLKRAERTGLVDGWEAKVIGNGDAMVATCTVWRKDRNKPTIIEAWFPEYNTGQSLWKSKPRTMLRKVAIAQAFRMAFPDDLGGMPYTADEMGTEGTHDDIEFTTLEAMSGKIGEAEDVAQKDLDERKKKATAWLVKNGQSISAAQDYLKKSYGDWNQGDMDQLKIWGKQNFVVEELPLDEG